MSQGLHKSKKYNPEIQAYWRNILEMGEVLGESICFSFYSEKWGNMFTSSTNNGNLSLLLSADDKQGKHLT